MESYLTKASIYDLWGMPGIIDIPLDRKFNFIIGRNGTGKTTVINLIAAVLTADFERLDKIQFSRVVILLGTIHGRKKPSIEVTKEQKNKLPYYDIIYKIKLSAGEEPTVYDLDTIAEERSYRGVPPQFLRERSHRERFVYIQRQLQDMVKVNWLSVHRSNSVDRGSEERRFIPAIDQKLTDLNNTLVRYFSKLATLSAEKTVDFQKTSFLALTSIHEEADIEAFVQSINIEQEKTSLSSIFELLGVDKKLYTKQVDQVAQDFSHARKQFLEHSGISMSQLFAIATSYRTHSLVQLYEELQERKRKIFEPVSKFLVVLNRLFAPGKHVSISGQNELVVKNMSGAVINIEDLSSGEKQLLIILGQALLQESSPVVFIADEPELSLHVEWQEQLSPSIAELNPNAQVIFATHSPDIVGSYTNRILDMKRIVG
jgi:predicted ATPase